MPNLLSYLISFITNGEEQWKGYIYTTGIVVLNLGKTISFSQYLYGLNVVGLRIRSALTCAIYAKLLRLGLNEKKENTGIEDDTQFVLLGKLFFQNDIQTT